MQIRVPNSGNSRLKYSNFPLFGRSRNPFVLYNIGGQTPQTIADFEADKYASANKNLGPELVTNGTFDSDFTDWSDINSPTKAVVSGEAEITGDAFDGILQNIAVTSGSLYKISFDITSKTGAVGYAIYAGANATSTNLLNIINSDTGTQEHFLLATTNIFSVVVWSRGTAVTFTFDNVSVREVVSYSPASTTAENLLTHTRSGNAVQVADDGTLQWAGHNLLKYSEDFSNAAWGKNRASVSLADNGYFNLIQNDETFSGGVAQNITISASATQTISFEAKAGTADFVFVREVLLDGSVNNTWFNLSTGAVGQTDAGHTASMTPLDDGSYLCSISFTNDGTSRTGLVTIFVSFADGSTASSVEDNGKTVLIRKPRAYRSDLGGMADIPTSYRGLSSSSTYLPTTSSVRYLPRVDNHIWDGSSWVKRCLVEPQSTNLFDYSVPDNSNWTVSASTLTENVSGVTSPDGNENFAFLREDATTAIHYLADRYAFVLGTTYTLSGFVKQATSDEVIQLIFPVPAFGAVYANFDFSTGSFGTSSGVTTHVEDFGNGIYRIGITATATASSENVCGFVLTNNDDSAGRVPSYLGDNTSGFYIWGAQLEASSVPTSYIPTAGSQVTRPTDALSIDSTLLPYDSTAMTIAMEGEMTYADTNQFAEVYFWRWLADANNQIYANLRTNQSVDGGRLNFWQVVSGVGDSATSSDIYTPGINVPFNIASRNTSSDINGAVDGTALTANTTPTALPDLSAADFEIAYTGVVNIKSLRILGGYGATNAELEAATT